MVKKLLYHWLSEHRLLLTNAISLVGATAATSGLGFVYWWLAARLFAPEVVGLSSAAISSMLLLGTVSLLGLNSLLLGELPRRPEAAGSLMSAALLLVGAFAALLGICYAAIVPLTSSDLRTLGATIPNVLLFAGGVSLTAITSVLDQALIGLLRGPLQFWRNTLFALTKLLALCACGLWIAQVTGMTIYATWMIGNICSLAALALFVWFKKGRPVRLIQPHWRLLQSLGLTALKHHALNLTQLAPVQVLPIIVTVMLSARVNAWFYVSQAITNLIIMLPLALTIVLYAESSAQPSQVIQKTRLTFSASFLICGCAIAFIWLLGGQVLALFGNNYAQGAGWSLRILSLEAFPVIIRDHYSTISRIKGRAGSATLPFVAIGIFQLTGAMLGAYYAGLPGLCWGWVITDCLGALFLLPTVCRIIFPPRPMTSRRSFGVSYFTPPRLLQEKGSHK